MSSNIDRRSFIKTALAILIPAPIIRYFELRAEKKRLQAEAIFRAFLGTCYQPNRMDVQHEPLYDSLTIGEYESRGRLS